MINDKADEVIEELLNHFLIDIKFDWKHQWEREWFNIWLCSFIILQMPQNIFWTRQTIKPYIDPLDWIKRKEQQQISPIKEIINTFNML